MSRSKFTYGPVARGIYTALLWLTIVIGWHFNYLLTYYVPFLIFLGIGLRPLLEKSGAYDLYLHLSRAFDEKRHRKFIEQRRMEVDKKVRHEKMRRNRVRDPRLPKNW